MKIDEIFGSPTQIRVGNPTKIQYRSILNKTKLGSGSYGFARDNPIDPHLVAKRNFGPISPDRDAYYTYIKYIVDHNMAEDNIHVPRVYHIQLLPTATTDTNKNFPQTFFYRIDIEKLVMGYTLDIDDMWAVVRATVDEDMVNSCIGFKYEPENLFQHAIINPIRQYLYETDNHIIDKKLKEVLDVVKELKRTPDPTNQYDLFSFDTHTGNYMFRRTSVGCQLVVVDPLS